MAQADPGPTSQSFAHSPAFREASLRSEVRRAWAVIGTAALLAGLVFRGESAQGLEPKLKLVGAAGIASLLVLQAAVLLYARRARSLNRMIPTWFVVGTVVVESLIPSAIVLQIILLRMLRPYSALNTPPVLVYGMMLSLTTLRLRPWLCVLAGTAAAASYAGMLAYITYGLGIAEPTTGLPYGSYINNAILLFIGGLAAALVAREIRSHVEAALGEAETRRQMGVIEQDLAAASSIQQALLPRGSPSIPGFEVAGWNRPADQTGGDYYDWQAMPDGNWIVTLADVSGHGIGPAMVTAACRAYVRASSSNHGDLGSLTSRINRLLADDLPEGRFITMVNVLIDPRSGSVGLLSAGHGPIALYVGSSGTVRDILPNDVPLAVIPDQTFGPAQAITMAAGDVLALVTDGFVEWPRHDAAGRREQFGLPRLRESLQRHAALPAAPMIEAITADVAAFAGGERQQDDLTMVIIRRLPAP